MGARRSVLAALGVFAVALAVGLLVGGDEESPLAPHAADAALADAVPYDGRSPREPAGDEVRVLVELSRPALGNLAGVATLSERRQRRHVASLQEEGRALRSGLEARGLQLRDVVTFERTWNGFAATVRARDIQRLAQAGLNATPVRRFYPALSEPVPLPGRGRAPAGSGPAPGGRPVAILAGGSEGAGYDAVDRDADPSPGGHPADPARLELDGVALAAIVSAAGRAVMPIRVAAQRPEEYARSDELLLGLERAVDPDGDGAVGDRCAVALVGVNAPFAGFATAPEARAAAAARRLGVRVVAPAGHEGAGGTVGSPGGAPSALTVGALSRPESLARLVVRVDDAEYAAAALAGAPPARLPAGPVTSTEDPEDLLRAGAPPLQGRLALVRAGVNPGAQAAAAAAAGARAVLLLEPRRDRALPAMPAGRLTVPVAGLTGGAAEQALELKPGAMVAFGRPAAPDVRDGGELSRFSSTGPAPGGSPKPDVAAAGWATVTIGGRRFQVAGAAVAAARVAAGLAGGPQPPVVRGAAAGSRRPGPPAPAVLGELELTQEGDAVTGVRFTAGAFERGDPPAGKSGRIAPVQRLELLLVDRRNRRVRRLTPPGGARELLPGEYAYTLPAVSRRRLRAGAYAFEARAWAPRQIRPTVRRSSRFEP